MGTLRATVQGVMMWFRSMERMGTLLPTTCGRVHVGACMRARACGRVHVGARMWARACGRVHVGACMWARACGRVHVGVELSVLTCLLTLDS
jgi:hypothetical protein